MTDEGNGVKYEKFVKANRQALEECLPKKTNARKSLRSSKAQMVSVYQEAQAAQSLYENTNTEVDKEAWSQALRNLYKVYDQVSEVELETQIRIIEASHGAQKYGEAWKIVDEITGRKSAKEGQVEGSSPEERLITWFTHFKKLLGNPPEVEDVDEEIPNILEDLDINDGLFTIEELKKVKSSLKIGKKAAGPDAIPSEVFKLCDFTTYV